MKILDFGFSFTMVDLPTISDELLPTSSTALFVECMMTTSRSATPRSRVVAVNFLPLLLLSGRMSTTAAGNPINVFSSSTEHSCCPPSSSSSSSSSIFQQKPRLSTIFFTERNLNQQNHEFFSSSLLSPKCSGRGVIVAPSLRGGGGGGIDDASSEIGAHALVMDLTRTTIRLDSIGTYSLVSALLLQATFKLYSDNNATKKKSRRNNKIYQQQFQNRSYDDTDIMKLSPCQDYGKHSVIHFIFVVWATISILCGAYTTVVFSLLGAYCKTALGLSRDVAFQEFYDATRRIRHGAFHVFRIALMSFQISFLSSLYLNYKSKLRTSTVLIAIIALKLSWEHWQNIIILARLLLFQQRK